MAQFVSQSDHVAESTVVVGEDSALPDGFHTGTECAAGLAFSGEKVDPLLVEGGGDHLGFLGVEAFKLLYQEILCLLGGELGGGGAHGGKQIIPGKTILMAQSLALGLQILPELGKILVHSAQHGIQGGLLHIGVIQRSCQRGCVAAELAIGQGFQLDGVQRESGGVLDPVVAGDLRFIGFLSHLGIGIVCQISHSGQVDGLIPVGDRHGRGDIAMEVAPCVAAGKLHPGHDRLCLARQQVLAGLGQIFKQEGVLF